MSSFMQPVRPIEAVPWGWNPGQTFVTAFNKKAALELDKMQFEVERQSLMLDMARDAQRQVHRSQMSGLTGGSGGGNNAPATNAQQPPAQPRFRPFGTSAPQTSQEEMVTI
jgi:hypothetical protein